MQRTSASSTASRFARSLAMAAGLAASAAQAGLVNVDFNNATSATYTGAGVLGTSSSVWNGVVVPSTAMSNIALNDDSGAASTARLSSNLGGFGFAAVPGSCSWLADLSCDYLVANNRTITFSISGLTAGDAYDLVLYFMPLATGRTTQFRVGSTTKTATSGSTLASSFVENQTYVRFTGNVAANGVLAFDLIGGQFSTEGDLNGFQLNVGATPSASVPEPTTLALALAALGAASLQRRRRG